MFPRSGPGVFKRRKGIMGPGLSPSRGLPQGPRNARPPEAEDGAMVFLLRVLGQFLIAQVPVLPELQRAENNDERAEHDVPEL